MNEAERQAALLNTELLVASARIALQVKNLPLPAPTPGAPVPWGENGLKLFDGGNAAEDICLIARARPGGVDIDGNPTHLELPGFGAGDLANACPKGLNNRQWCVLVLQKPPNKGFDNGTIGLPGAYVTFTDDQNNPLPLSKLKGQRFHNVEGKQELPKQTALRAVREQTGLDLESVGVDKWALSHGHTLDGIGARDPSNGVYGFDAQGRPLQAYGFSSVYYPRITDEQVDRLPRPCPGPGVPQAVWLPIDALPDLAQRGYLHVDHIEGIIAGLRAAATNVGRHSAEDVETLMRLRSTLIGIDRTNPEARTETRTLFPGDRYRQWPDVVEVPAPPTLADLTGNGIFEGSAHRPSIVWDTRADGWVRIEGDKRKRLEDQAPPRE